MEKTQSVYQQMLDNEINKQCAKNGLTREDLEIMLEEEREEKAQFKMGSIMDKGLKIVARNVGQLPVEYIW